MAKVEQQAESRWAHEEFGRGRFGDERRRVRAVRIAERAAQSPSGRVSDVFQNSAERQAAYDFLESRHVRVEALVESMQQACVERCSSHPFVFVPVDGTSLSLTDRGKKKDFGAVGSYAQGGRGLKVLGAIAVSPNGSPLGVCTLQWWARPKHKPKHRHRCSAARKVAEKETQHWVNAIEQSAQAFKVPSETRAWFQLDREGDAWPVLRKLAESECWFTVRSRSNRRLRTARGIKRYLHDARDTAVRHSSRQLHVPAGPRRTKRVAELEVHATSVPLDLLNAWTKSHYRLPLNVVFVRETHGLRQEKSRWCGPF
ncbi:MAG: transposase DNA-binding-containing protein [Polyangiaceae bacterium]